MKQNASLQTELDSTINWLNKYLVETPGTLQFFYDLAKRYFSEERPDPEKFIPVIGTVFPEEYIISCSRKPWWIIGGSLCLSQGPDEAIPRDADSLSRSIYGYINSDIFPENLPLIVPITGDNYRKMGYLLSSSGKKVYPLELVGNDNPALKGIMTDRFDDIMNKLSLKWSLPGRSRRINRACRLVSRAGDSIRNLMAVPGIPGAIKIFLINTYYYSDDLDAWCRHIDEARAALADLPAGKRPRVLIIGSPIVFPNYKILKLLDECGLDIAGCCDSISSRFYMDHKAFGISDMAEAVCRMNCSGSRADSSGIYAMISKALETNDISGIIVHIIKGQIEYDFAMDELDKLFSEKELPVFRIETDFHENDIEQLSIRLDAFAELLNVGREQ